MLGNMLTCRESYALFIYKHHSVKYAASESGSKGLTKLPYLSNLLAKFLDIIYGDLNLTLQKNADHNNLSTSTHLTFSDGISTRIKRNFSFSKTSKQILISESFSCSGYLTKSKLAPSFIGIVHCCVYSCSGYIRHYALRPCCDEMKDSSFHMDSLTAKKNKKNNEKGAVHR